MRIVAVLEAELEAGGGFHQALATIIQLRERHGESHDIRVLTTQPGNVEVLRRLGVEAHEVRIRLLDHIVARAALSPWWRPVQRWLKVVPPLENRLLAMQCDLVIFLNPTWLANALQRLNFVATVLDLAHRDEPAFPEVREFGNLRAREHQLSCLSSAVLVITDSDESAQTVVRRYGIDCERIVAIPFAASPFMTGNAADDTVATLRRYALEPGFFFYPAQFWPHKNHIGILEAMLILRHEGEDPRVVFAGGDKGSRQHVESFVARHNLRDRVRFLGLVPSGHMRALYDGCRAVVMPTYFGPTNIPPLEAWTAGRPCIYPAAFREHVGDAALCVDPDDAASLAAAMRCCSDPEVVRPLIERGHARLREIGRRREEAFETVWRRLGQFEARRRCWA